ncbi:hypothetical protein [Leucobacter sp. USHLN153]|uniref:hypothetical protein n=1 Tax=Leucobacter sp. USHLN153 TaxID=3081268 RepID=UPI00301A9431
MSVVSGAALAAVWRVAEEDTEFDPSIVTPGFEGFIFTGILAAGIIVLGFLLVSRLRRSAYRAEVREQIEQEIAEQEIAEQNGVTGTQAKDPGAPSELRPEPGAASGDDAPGSPRV